MAGLLALTGCTGAGAAQDGTVNLQMVESLTNPARTELTRELLDEFEAENPEHQGRPRLPAHRPGRPEDPADAPVGQRRRHPRGARHHRRAVQQQRLAVRHDGRRHGLGGLGRPDRQRARPPRTRTAGRYYVRTASTGCQPLLPHRPRRGSGLRRRRRRRGRSCWSRPPRSRTRRRAPYGYAFRGGPNGNGNVVAAIEAYDDRRPRPSTNALPAGGRSTIFSAPEAHDAVDTYFDAVRGGVAAVVRRRGATPRWSRASPTARRPSCSRTPK